MPPILPDRRLIVAARFQATDGPERPERGGDGRCTQTATRQEMSMAVGGRKDICTR